MPRKTAKHNNNQNNKSTTDMIDTNIFDTLNKDSMDISEGIPNSLPTINN